MRWSDLKRKLLDSDQKELLRLLKALYELNQTNKAFFEAALGASRETAIASYKRDIAEAIDPQGSAPIELRKGRKAISDYKKAVPGDLLGHVDLMLHYVEAGTNHTLTYGDIDEGFYDSLCSMIDQILKVSSSLPSEEHRRCAERLAALDDRTRGQIGWGYSDHVADAAEEIASQAESR